MPRIHLLKLWRDSDFDDRLLFSDGDIKLKIWQTGIQ